MRPTFYTILLLASLLYACGGDSTQTGPQAAGAAPAVAIDSTVVVEVPKTKPLPPAPPPPALVPGMDIPAKLDAWMQQVLAAEGSYSNRMQTIQRGQEEHKVMVFSDPEGKVRMMRADISGNKQLGTLQFFFNGGKVVLMADRAGIARLG
ncbi:MAG TPA: hypothetical protein PK971_11260, partial [Saprospiraceae bacterium]|nr:hypothetical protein [Saprospiraceae bacterium]